MMAAPIAVAPARGLDERGLLEQAFSRASGTPLITGNRIRLLRDAAENYPAWLDAIANARQAIHFESYIIWDDKQGAIFADALTAKAREGVRVHVLYDWLGAVGKTLRRFWDSMLRAGADVRAFNPPRLASPLGWIHRDHRIEAPTPPPAGGVSVRVIASEPWTTGMMRLGPVMAALRSPR